MSKTSECIAFTLFYFALVNFGAFVLGSLILGGDALNAPHPDGHFFLSDHGRLTEVSEGVWRYSRVHALSLFVTHPLGILSVAFVVLRKKKSATMTGRDGTTA